MNINNQEKSKYKAIWELKGEPLTVMQLGILMSRGERTIHNWLRRDWEDMKALRYKLGRFPLPPIVVHYYTTEYLSLDWLDGVDLIDILKKYNEECGN